MISTNFPDDEFSVFETIKPKVPENSVVVLHDNWSVRSRDITVKMADNDVMVMY